MPFYNSFFQSMEVFFVRSHGESEKWAEANVKKLGPIVCCLICISGLSGLNLILCEIIRGDE